MNLALQVLRVAFFDLLVIAGALVVVYGLFRAWTPLGFIAVGVLMIFVALLFGRRLGGRRP